MTKRALDIIASLTGLILLSPVLALCAVLIWLESRGPILYAGQRSSRNGGTFSILKFRTMVPDADKIGSSSTAGDDPRITRTGSVLRRLKIDELPQLFNVLLGEMSLVGPRPQVPWAVALYREDERRLLSVRPGITDWASLYYRNEGEILRGSSDPDADYLRLIAPGKTRLGLLYVDTHGLLIDLQIITATVLVVFGIAPDWCFSNAQHAAVAGPAQSAVRQAA